MYFVEQPKIIGFIINIFHIFGLWRLSGKQWMSKMYISVHYLLFPLSLTAGAYETDDKDESVFLIEIALATVVLWVQLLYVIWKKQEILEFLNDIRIDYLEDYKQFIATNKTMQIFAKLSNISCFSLVLAEAIAYLVFPFIGSERTFFIRIWLPWDWRKSEHAYWMAFLFLISQVFLTLIAFLFSILTWYLLINCPIKYQILGHQVVNMGGKEKDNTSNFKERRLFERDLIAAINSFVDKKESINRVNSFLSRMFAVQFATSGFCICGAIYSIIFNVGGNMVKIPVYAVIMLYHIVQIFLVMWSGNGIMLESGRLSYCLFESDWIKQPQSVKKCLVIFGEILRKPHTLVNLKLYPITLETFTRVLKSAYSIFNLMQKFK